MKHHIVKVIWLKLYLDGRMLRDTKISWPTLRWASS